VILPTHNQLGRQRIGILTKKNLNGLINYFNIFLHTGRLPKFYIFK